MVSAFGCEPARLHYSGCPSPYFWCWPGADLGPHKSCLTHLLSSPSNPAADLAAASTLCRCSPAGRLRDTKPYSPAADLPAAPWMHPRQQYSRKGRRRSAADVDVASQDAVALQALVVCARHLCAHQSPGSDLHADDQGRVWGVRSCRCADDQGRVWGVRSCRCADDQGRVWGVRSCRCADDQGRVWGVRSCRCAGPLGATSVGPTPPTQVLLTVARSRAALLCAPAQWPVQHLFHAVNRRSRLTVSHAFEPPRTWFMPAMTLVKPALRSTLTQVSLDARLSSK